MTKSQRLGPIVKIARSNEEEAARILSETQTVLLESRKRLADLHQFRDDYSQQFIDSGAEGLAGSRMKNFQEFLKKIDEAIISQEQNIVNAQQDLELKKQQWYRRHTKTKVLDNVVTKYKQEEIKIEDKNDQRITDEFAINASRRGERNKNGS